MLTYTGYAALVESPRALPGTPIPVFQQPAKATFQINGRMNDPVESAGQNDPLKNACR
jgi:hypothetical protein